MLPPALLILDLDETLIYGTESPLDRRADFRVGPFHVYCRPFLSPFLAAAAERFELAVWSSGSDPYVRGIAGQLFEGLGSPRFIWSRDRCTPRLDPESREEYWLKDLKKVKRQGYPLDRVLVVDDTPKKLQRHYGNLVRVLPFFGDPSDTELRDLTPALTRLAGVDDVRRVEKRTWRAWAGSADGPSIGGGNCVPRPA